MENASKALIIVGAVLIAILLIGFGVLIMSNSTSQVNPDTLNSQAAQTHNSQFNNYMGERMTAQQVKQLMTIVTSNNVTGASADEPQHVYIHVNGNIGTATGESAVTGWQSPARVSAAVRNGWTYRVWVANTNSVSINEVGATINSGTIEAPTPTTTGVPQDASYYSNGYIRVIEIQEQR